ncbi:hypothetical protein PGT21_030391 [Puccinia graminis f. sp. tritici]|uniref:Uncharacterized protein n=1 Tax=Puccinia graminis f. sp. tritici TaxID=56615 RepID=A0A5B0MQ01_PUCGR|nr:hypothetical protein PGTUg99_019282 [Puccinia graminis f. sp. tritici]KAA1094798.1 hypothetical protein PGT21_030391 [Puccinia graminis f. sp. tritici]
MPAQCFCASLTKRTPKLPQEAGHLDSSRISKNMYKDGRQIASDPESGVTGIQTGSFEDSRKCARKSSLQRGTRGNIENRENKTRTKINKPPSKYALLPKASVGDSEEIMSLRTFEVIAPRVMKINPVIMLLFESYLREHQPRHFIDGTPENLTISTLVFEALMWIKNDNQDLKNPFVKDLQSGENIVDIEKYLITQFKEL